MQCDTCGQQCRPAGDSEALLDWTLVHAGRNAGHRGFSEVITRPYLVFASDSGLGP